MTTPASRRSRSSARASALTRCGLHAEGTARGIPGSGRGGAAAAAGSRGGGQRADAAPRVRLRPPFPPQGGLNLKTAAGMKTMKKDMGGAALMLALGHYVMAAGLRVKLRLLVPAVENAVSGDAYRPLDVLRTRAGITIEQGNCDAEGRLILADALYEAATARPDLVIDAATLTVRRGGAVGGRGGACAAACLPACLPALSRPWLQHQLPGHTPHPPGRRARGAWPRGAGCVCGRRRCVAAA